MSTAASTNRIQPASPAPDIERSSQSSSPAAEAGEGKAADTATPPDNGADGTADDAVIAGQPIASTTSLILTDDDEEEEELEEGEHDEVSTAATEVESTETEELEEEEELGEVSPSVTQLKSSEAGEEELDTHPTAAVAETGEEELASAEQSDQLEMEDELPWDMFANDLMLNDVINEVCAYQLCKSKYIHVICEYELIKSVFCSVQSKRASC